MNRPLWLLALAQALFLTNNVAFIAINGLVGLELAPWGWMATLPVMGYVVGGALSTHLVALTQARFGRKASFQLGALVALLSVLLCAYASWQRQFNLLCLATVVAGYFNANAQLYRFAAAELASAPTREKAVSLVMAGGLLGAVVGPNLAAYSRNLLGTPFVGSYLALVPVALASLALVSAIDFPPQAKRSAQIQGRTVVQLLRQPAFLVSTLAGSLCYGTMNLLMTATPIAMQQCKLSFSNTALVLEWHVIGMFAPGFFTGHLIRRFGALPIMAVGIALNLLCILVALHGVELHHFVLALFTLGLGWNFLFTGATTLSLQSYKPEEKDRAQAAQNFFLFATLALSSFSSGLLVTTRGWWLLNMGSLIPLLLMAAAVMYLWRKQRTIVGS